MRPSPTSLTGSLLAFDRTGDQLAIIAPDAVSIIDLHRDRDGASHAASLPIADARAVAAFGDQIWIATSTDQLVRVAPDGRALGEPVALPFAGRAILAPAPCGPPAVVWASAPHAAVYEDGGIVQCTLQPEADAVIPLTCRRFVIARGSRLTLPSGIATQLPPNWTVSAGAMIADGRSVVLLAAHGGARQLLVVSTSTGEVVQRCTVPGAIVRIATQRAIAIAQLEPRVGWVLDLQGRGRELGTFRVDHDLHDFAIDPTGRRAALRLANGTIDIHDVTELVQRTTVVTVPPTSEAASPSEAAPDRTSDESERRTSNESESRTSDESDESDERTGRMPDLSGSRPPDVSEVRIPARRHDGLGLAGVKLCALEPREASAELEPAQAQRALDQELRSVMLWTLDAISSAWDTRRLGYANEGRHPFELEVGAILGLNQGFAAEYVEAARARLAEHERAVAADPDWRGPATPIGVLAAELGLSERAVDVMLVIGAAALWGEVARLYGILGNDAGRAIVDELLVQQVLAGRHHRDAIAAELDPRAPLVRLGIVQPRGKRSRPFAELAIDPVILDRLRGVAPALGAAIAIREAGAAIDELDVPREVLEAAIGELARPRTTAARIAVRGRIGSGRRTLLAALAAHAHRRLAVIDVGALPRPDPESFAVELAHALRRAQLAALVPCVVGLEDVAFGELAGRDVAVEVMRLHPGPVAVIASVDEQVPFPAGYLAIALPVLGETARTEVWARALAEAGLAVDDAGVLAARYRIGPGVIRRAVAAAAQGPARGDATPLIEGYIRQTRDKRLGQYARRVERLASWSSIVLPSDILDSLRELVARVRHGRTVFEAWGMSRMMSTSRGLTALFQGPPGTGKTLVAGVIARELGLDLYQVDLSKVMSKWIGETERHLATIFDAAEDGQVVVLFDEADSLFAKRTEVRSSNDRYANLEVNYLLQRLDSFEGIAILTTNSGTSIDQAFKRRMSFRLSFPFPDEDTRERLWRAHLPPELPIAGPLALDALAHKYQLSGGYIRNACLRAAFLAAQDETVLHQRHLERAVALEYAELGKLSSGGAID